MEFHIRKYRELRGMTYEQLSKVSGVAKSYIQKLENDNENVNPSARILCKLSKALQVPIEKLFDCD